MYRLVAFACGFLLTVVVTTKLMAADLGKPAPAPVVAEVTQTDLWRKCYAELGAGGRITSDSQHSAIGTVGGGCDAHWAGQPYVVGIFARYGFSADFDKSTKTATAVFDQPITLAGRAGYLIQQDTLLYGIAGYSYSKDTGKGPILGAGVERMMWGTLSIAAEYHAQLPEKSADPTTHDVWIGLKHRF